jgi:hypothetical protein
MPISIIFVLLARSAGFIKGAAICLQLQIEFRIHSGWRFDRGLLLSAGAIRRMLDDVVVEAGGCCADVAVGAAAD